MNTAFVSLVDQKRAIIRHFQKEVASLTGISTEDQGALMFEAAFEWLALIGCRGTDQTAMASTSQFWGFWKLQWHDMDRLFVERSRLFKHLDRVELYHDTHAIRFTNRALAASEVNYHYVIKDLAKTSKP